MCGADGDTYYFVAEVPNNADDFFIDDIPDIGLGSQAPGPLDSIPFPSYDVQILRELQRLFVYRWWTR